MSRLLRLRTLFSLGVALAAPLGAAVVQPSGPELELAVLEDGTSEPRPAAAYAGDGRAAVVWADRGFGLRLRFLSSDGAPTTGVLDLVANLGLPTFPGEGTVIFRKEPVAAFEDDGSLLVAWTEETGYERSNYFEDHYDVLERDVLAQRFGPAGAPAGPRFRVNPSPGGYQSRPALVRLRCLSTAPRTCGDGSLAIVWQADDLVPAATPGDGLFGRVFDHDDHPVTGQLRIAPPGVERNAALAADDLGNFLVVYDNLGDGDGRAVYARRFNCLGRALSRPQMLNKTILGHQMRPAVAFSGNGYLAAWQSPTGEQDAHRVYGVLLDRLAKPRSGELTLSQGETEWELLPALAPFGGGYFLLWMDWSNGLPESVVGVSLAAADARRGAEVPISSGRLVSQYTMSLVAGPNGALLALWEGGRGNDATVVARRLQIVR